MHSPRRDAIEILAIKIISGMILNG